MKKSDRKTERALVQALTKVCEEALESVAGFRWITHFVNYSAFPGSLLIVAVFATDDELAAARARGLDRWLFAKIDEQMQAIGVSLPNKQQQLRMDSEEACERDNHGNWQERYR